MENEQLQQAEPPPAPEPRLPYAPPTATFVSLELEERLKACLLESGCSSPS